VRLGVEAAVVEGVLLPGDVEIADGRIAGVGLAGPGRGVAVPGFVDVHVNGFGGVDFAAADAVEYRRAGRALLETGVTAFQPTLITAAEDELTAALAEVPTEPVGPHLLGVHLEGPFIAPGYLGAHPAEGRRDPDEALLERLLAAGPVRYVTLAPELPGALELIDALHARGIVVSLGHTGASAGEAELAFARGVGTVTHLFNAMRPFHHREPGIAGAALARPDVVVQIILDGHHLAAETALLAWRAAGGRLALVTDAIAAAGNGGTNGRSRLGGHLAVEVRDGAVRGPAGELAGSVLTMPEAIRNLHELGVPLVDAVAAATAVPARAARLDGVGVLREGGPADVVVLDDELRVRTVLVSGEELVAA
jgi:N-acetylglucosamine-6-phosphate deacetylase